jgi:signal transduction histidine kinase
MLRLLLESTLDAVVLLDPSGRVAHLNRPAADLLGDAGQIGTPVEQLARQLVPELADRAGQDLERTLTDGRVWRATVELLVEPGRTASYSCSVHRGVDGTAIVARDLSETRLREAAEREVSARDVFVARLGHELRTPLNAALGFAQLLELGDLPNEQREDIARILTAGRHMQALLDEVLDLSRVRGGGIDLDVGPVPVLEVVQGVVDLVEPLADRRLVRRLVDVGGSVEQADALIALADRRRLWQVLLNLVGNAVKYGREGGLVRVAVRRGGAETVVVEVTDDGPGIDPAALHRVFRPFDRLGQERSGVEGTGLGLAMAQALTQAMSGTLVATSMLGSGTTFTLTLPAMPAAPDEPDAAGTLAQPRSSCTSAARRERAHWSGRRCGSGSASRSSPSSGATLRSRRFGPASRASSCSTRSCPTPPRGRCWPGSPATRCRRWCRASCSPASRTRGCTSACAQRERTRCCHCPSMCAPCCRRSRAGWLAERSQHCGGSPSVRSCGDVDHGRLTSRIVAGTAPATVSPRTVIFSPGRRHLPGKTRKLPPSCWTFSRSGRWGSRAPWVRGAPCW